MKLIFNQDDIDLYLEEFLPFIDRDTKWTFLKPHIISAQKEIEKTIGKETFALAITAFDSEILSNQEPETEGDQPHTMQDIEKDILYFFRLPIMLYAYKIYAPTNDLRHGNNGRTMTRKEDEVTPFDWMLDRDNENLERSFYRELDNLISFLDQFKVWRESETYKKIRSLFVYAPSIFDEHFPINSRLLLLKLEPGLRQAERKHIVPVIGQTLSKKLKDFILQSEIEDLNIYPETPPENPPAEPEEEPDPITLDPLEREVLKLVEEACVYYSLSWAMKRLTVTLFPEGVLQSYIGDRNTSKARKTPEHLQTQLAAQEFQKDAEDVLKLIQNSISEMQTEELEDVEDLSEFQLDSDIPANPEDNFLSL